MVDIPLSFTDKLTVSESKKEGKKKGKFTWKSSRIDDVDAVGGHQAPLGLGHVSTDGTTLGEDGVVVTERLAAPTCLKFVFYVNVSKIFSFIIIVIYTKGLRLVYYAIIYYLYR